MVWSLAQTYHISFHKWLHVQNGLSLPCPLYGFSEQRRLFPGQARALEMIHAFWLINYFTIYILSGNSCAKTGRVNAFEDV